MTFVYLHRFGSVSNGVGNSRVSFHVDRWRLLAARTVRVARGTRKRCRPRLYCLGFLPVTSPPKSLASKFAVVRHTDRRAGRPLHARDLRLGHEGPPRQGPPRSHHERCLRGQQPADRLLQHGIPLSSPTIFSNAQSESSIISKLSFVYTSPPAARSLPLPPTAVPAITTAAFDDHSAGGPAPGSPRRG